MANTPDCCPTDTRWRLLQNILALLNGEGPTPPPPSGDSRITESGDTRTTEGGDTRIIE